MAPLSARLQDLAASTTLVCGGGAGGGRRVQTTSPGACKPGACNLAHATAYHLVELQWLDEQCPGPLQHNCMLGSEAPLMRGPPSRPHTSIITLRPTASPTPPLRPQASSTAAR